MDRRPSVRGPVVIALALATSACAPEGLACGTISCEPGQLCVPPRDPCDPVDDSSSCPAADRCELHPGARPGCFRRAPAGPGLCLDVPAECDEPVSCACPALMASVPAGWRCVYVDESGYLQLAWNR